MILALLAGGAHTMLRDLAIVLVVAAVTTVVFQRLRQPVVLGYLVAGLVVGPHTPGASVSDVGTVQAFSELGMILVLFSIGLEFSARRLVALGPRPAFAALLESGTMLWLGFLAARAFGLEARQGLFVGAVVAISSTVLIQRAFAESPPDPRVRDLVMGMLIYEDLVAIVLFALLSTLALGGAVDSTSLGRAAGPLALFLVLAVGLGLLVVPAAMRFIVALGRSETLIVASLGLCFALSLTADRLGLSTALGAFLAGSLIAESGHGELVHERIRPVADVFVAIFFVSIGMLVDPAEILPHSGKIAVLVAVVLVGKVLATGLGTFLVGEERTTALRSGVCMAQVGEFSFLFAALGATTGAAPAWLAGAAVGVSSVTAFLTPYLVGRATAIAAALDRALPRRLRTFASLHTAWMEDVRAAGTRTTAWRLARRAGLITLVDTLVLAALTITAVLLQERLAGWLGVQLGFGDVAARWAVIVAAAVVAVPLVFGILTSSRRLAALLAGVALPGVEARRPDLAAAPRRALVVGLQLGVLVLVVLALLAVTEPFLPVLVTPAVLVVAAIPVAWVLWRTATDLQGHVRAGSSMIAEALLRDRDVRTVHEAETVQELLPGLGEITFVGVEPGSAGAGQTLGDLDLRGRHGVLVAAIARGETSIAAPSDEERLSPGDRLALTGSHDGVAAAIADLAQRTTIVPSEK